MKKAKMILMSILLVFTFSMLAGCGTKNGRKAADETKRVRRTKLPKIMPQRIMPQIKRIRIKKRKMMEIGTK